MQQKELELNKQDERKKALIGDGLLLFVLVVGIILAVFAWFSVMSDSAKARGLSFISNDNLDIRFNTYPGTVLANGSIAYDEEPLMNLNNPDFDEVANTFTLFPGEKKYFKTVINNYELSQHSGTFTLQSMLVNKKLVTTQERSCITFGSNLEDDTYQQSFELSSYQPYYVGGQPDPTYYSVSTQPIYENITLPAATQDGGNKVAGTFTVYWYVILNGDAVDNEVMGEPMLKFTNIKFIASS